MDPYVIPDSDEDADLALAIQMSLREGNGEPSGVKRKADLIVIEDSDEDVEEVSYRPNVSYRPMKWEKETVKMGETRETRVEEVREVRTIEAKPTRMKIAETKTSELKNTETWATETKPTGPYFVGIDRAQMERERLLRLEKPVAIPYAIKQRLDNIMPSKQKLPGPFRPSMPYKLTPADSSSSSSTLSGLKFPHGVVKKTWVKDVPRDGTDITIEEVLQKETLYGAVLSAFQWDHEWLWSKIPEKKLQRFVLVMQAKEERDKKAILEVLGGLPKTSIVFPPMEKANCMHSKLMLLFHRNPTTGEDWLRIAVPSANLTDYDWGEGGTMENVTPPSLPRPHTANILDRLHNRPPKTPIRKTRTNTLPNLPHNLPQCPKNAR